MPWCISHWANSAGLSRTVSVTSTLVADTAVSSLPVLALRNSASISSPLWGLACRTEDRCHIAFSTRPRGFPKPLITLLYVLGESRTGLRTSFSCEYGCSRTQDGHLFPFPISCERCISHPSVVQGPPGETMHGGGLGLCECLYESSSNAFSVTESGLLSSFLSTRD